jgi:hypothetical protein
MMRFLLILPPRMIHFYLVMAVFSESSVVVGCCLLLEALTDVWYHSIRESMCITYKNSCALNDFNDYWSGMLEPGGSLREFERPAGCPRHSRQRLHA